MFESNWTVNRSRSLEQTVNLRCPYRYSILRSEMRTLCIVLASMSTFAKGLRISLWWMIEEYTQHIYLPSMLNYNSMADRWLSLMLIDSCFATINSNCPLDEMQCNAVVSLHSHHSFTNTPAYQLQDHSRTLSSQPPPLIGKHPV